MIFRLPKYCVKIKTNAMQASSPSCMPNGSINIINIIVTTQFEYSGRFYTPIPEIGNHRSDMKETAIPF